MPAIVKNKKMTAITVIFSTGMPGFQSTLGKLPDYGSSRVSAETKRVTHGVVYCPLLRRAEGKVESILINRIDVG